MKFSLFSLTLTLALVGGAARAQGPGSGGPVPGGPTPPEPTAVPIDGGASLLAAGAVAYGLKHLRQRRRR